MIIVSKSGLSSISPAVVDDASGLVVDNENNGGLFLEKFRFKEREIVEKFKLEYHPQGAMVLLDLNIA